MNDKSWANIVKNVRKLSVKDSKEYLAEVFPKPSLKEKKALKKNISKFILKLYNQSYSEYLKDEHAFNYEIAEQLMLLPKANHLIDKLFKENILKLNESSSSEEIKEEFIKILAETIGNFDKEIYTFNLSTTQSRRTRAGKTFEYILRKIIEDIYEFDCDYQTKIGALKYKSNDFGSTIDIVIPSVAAYKKDRSRCVLLSSKTTLRERWGEVIAELVKANVPVIHLCTLDNKITEGVIEEASAHNIKLVMLKKEAAKHKKNGNVMSFEDFFNSEIKRIIK